MFRFYEQQEKGEFTKTLELYRWYRETKQAQLNELVAKRGEPEEQLKSHLKQMRKESYEVHEDYIAALLSPENLADLLDQDITTLYNKFKKNLSDLSVAQLLQLRDDIDKSDGDTMEKIGHRILLEHFMHKECKNSNRELIDKIKAELSSTPKDKRENRLRHFDKVANQDSQLLDRLVRKALEELNAEEVMSQRHRPK